MLSVGDATVRSPERGKRRTRTASHDRFLHDLRDQLWAMALRARLLLDTSRTVAERSRTQVARGRWRCASVRRKHSRRRVPVPKASGRLLYLQKRPRRE
jgi:hypothetical protein